MPRPSDHATETAIAALLLAVAPAALRGQSDWFPRPGTGPGARAYHATALDRARNQVLLFGGEAQGRPALSMDPFANPFGMAPSNGPAPGDRRPLILPVPATRRWRARALVA